jgi:hypothetical protein
MVKVYLSDTSDVFKLSNNPDKRFTNLSTFSGFGAWLTRKLAWLIGWLSPWSLKCAPLDTAMAADVAIKFSHRFRVRVDPGDITTKHGNLVLIDWKSDSKKWIL